MNCSHQKSSCESCGKQFCRTCNTPEAVEDKYVECEPTCPHCHTLQKGIQYD